MGFKQQDVTPGNIVSKNPNKFRVTENLEKYYRKLIHIILFIVLEALFE